jgi:caffeoyl-CoA O-methyltransferase
MPDKHVDLTDAVYNYLLAQRSDANDPLLAALYADTLALGEVGRYAVTPLQSSIISLLAGLVGTKWAVEVGTFTGISSIAIARNLVPGGKVHCFDQDFKYTSMARRYWIKAGLQDRIDLRLGDARRLVPFFRPREMIDFVHIDADKESYAQYYDHLCPYVRSGGMIIFDNTLRGGELAEPGLKSKPINRAMDALNRKLAADPRVQVVLLPIADGMTICRRMPAPNAEIRRVIDTRQLDRVRLGG